MKREEFTNFIKNKIILAPLAGVADQPFRILCKKYGADIVYSEMISVDAIKYKDKKTLEMVNFLQEESPIILQLFGDSPEVFKEALEIIKKMELNIIAIDLNSGCPVPKVVKRNAGAALMRNPEKLYSIVDILLENTNLPITVKIRKGWSNKEINFFEISEKLEKMGVSAITFHPRTRDEFFSGKADWDKIKDLKNSLSIPVIGNGDIFSGKDAMNMIQQTKCDAIMIGRGSFGNPTIFKEIKEYLNSGELLNTNLYDKINLIIEHLNLMIKYLGIEKALLNGRKHIIWYTKGWPNSAKLRNLIFKAKTCDEIENLLKEYLSEYGSIGLNENNINR